jgi:hypothetical protein
MSHATSESIPDHTLVTLTADEIQVLADRLFSRGISCLAACSHQEQCDVILASRALRELLHVYERGTGRELHAILLAGGQG